MGWFIVSFSNMKLFYRYLLFFKLCARYSRPYESIKYPCLKEPNILVRERSLRNAKD